MGRRLCLRSPTRFGQGKLVDKTAAAFTSASTPHGGHESTALAIQNVFYHWGAIIVSPGYATPDGYAAGSPYGQSAPTGPLEEGVIKGAVAQGRRLAEVTARLDS